MSTQAQAPRSLSLSPPKRDNSDKIVPGRLGLAHKMWYRRSKLYRRCSDRSSRLSCQDSATLSFLERCRRLVIVISTPKQLTCVLVTTYMYIRPHVHLHMYIHSVCISASASLHVHMAQRLSATNAGASCNRIRRPRSGIAEKCRQRRSARLRACDQLSTRDLLADRGIAGSSARPLRGARGVRTVPA